ncbi:hypothetical protein FKM82_010973 [Ascaphus truei]
MKSHLLLAHMEHEVNCPICTIAGLTYDELNFHIHTAHGETQEAGIENVQMQPKGISVSGHTPYEGSYSGNLAGHSGNSLQSKQEAGCASGISSDPPGTSISCCATSTKPSSRLEVEAACSPSGLCRVDFGKENCEQSNPQAQASASAPLAPCDMDNVPECPFCCEVQDSLEHLEFHVKIEHADLLDTPIKGDTKRQYECPMCSLVCTSCQILEEHVNLHLEESRFDEGKNVRDLELARRLQDEEDGRRRAEESQREQAEFQKLQRQFGLDNSGGYKQQSLQNMERAVASGRMQPMEFHRQKADMMESLAYGIDDGSTKTSGVMEALCRYYHNAGSEVSRVWLCSQLDHFSASLGDKGWGCGFRNFQMLLSSLLLNDAYKDCLQDFRSIPCIPKIQCMIEDAWKEGFDPHGASHFNGRLQGTKAWIGACEMYSLLTSLQFKCRILDFHKPSSPSGTHPLLFEWIWNYYASDIQGTGRIVCTSKPAIYLQHQGHSRTIVGIEERKNKTYCLLIFDPGCPSQNMQKLLKQNIDGASLKLLRKYAGSLKHKQYQIVAVEGALSPEEKAVRLQTSKIFRAERIP